MRITLAAIGRAKAGPELELTREYLKRLPWKVDIRELELKKDAGTVEKQKQEEALLLLKACEGADRIIALDERGKTLSSRELAGQLKSWSSVGETHVAFIIGGADGLAKEVHEKTDLLLSFGRLSWPHMLVRPMLAEQLYRAHTIISGHPYHRD